MDFREDVEYLAKTFILTIVAIGWMYLIMGIIAGRLKSSTRKKLFGE